MSTPKRAALYIRVSTEEQARHGYSLDAQKAELDQYAKKHGYIIYGYYIDDGVSAHKNPLKRKEFTRMLEDVKAGRIQIILFIKLDRWFRSVPDYYKAQEVLDTYKVEWNAVLEDYNTTTSAGRLNLNIRLSIAQNESEQTSDRIKFVFADKIRRGEVICGNVPLGYKIENKHLVPDEHAPMVAAAFEYYIKTHSLYRVRKFLFNNYGLTRHPKTLTYMFRMRTYIGEKYGNPDFCQPIITQETFDTVQVLLSHNLKRQRTDRIYLFSGLLRCPNCGTKLAVATASKRNDTLFISYRCPKRFNEAICKAPFNIAEKKMEHLLLEELHPQINAYITEMTTKNHQKPKPNTHIAVATLRAKLTKLKELYFEDLIDKEEYKRDYNTFTAELAEIRKEQAERPLPKINPIIIDLHNRDILTMYNNLSKEERKTFWLQIINRIEFRADKKPLIFFG